MTPLFFACSDLFSGKQRRSITLTPRSDWHPISPHRINPETKWRCSERTGKFPDSYSYHTIYSKAVCSQQFLTVWIKGVNEMSQRNDKRTTNWITFCSFSHENLNIYVRARGLKPNRQVNRWPWICRNRRSWLLDKLSLWTP